MIQKLRTSRKIRIVAANVLLALLFQLVVPLQSLALTSGPGQPEFQGFSTIDVSQNVDPLTGNFAYAIPLFEVPGPNGGYPLSLSYRSGQTMEQEASWVGLGWELNTGAIDRNVRGVPDDFRGPVAGNPESDFILKRQYLKPNVNVALGLNVSTNIGYELFGGALDFNAGVSANAQMYYNSYVGPGFMYGLGLSTAIANNSVGRLGANLNLNFDSNDGPSIQPSLSYAGEGAMNNNRFSVGMGYSSRQGVTSQNFSQSYGYDRYALGSNITYAAISQVPQVDMPMKGFNGGFQMDIEAGAVGNHLNVPIGFTGNLSVTEVKDFMQAGYPYPAFGSMYSELRMDNPEIENDRALMDYNREKDFPIHAKVPMLPIPVKTHDIYSVSGAGMGGTFTVNRNDAGIFYGPKTASDNVGINAGIEIAAAAGVKVGFDPTVTFARSYSGKWKSGDKKALHMMGFRKAADFSGSNGIRPNSPFSFKFSGEFLTYNKGEMNLGNKGGYGPAMLNIHQSPASFEDFSKLSEEVDDEEATKQMRKKNFFKDMPLFKAETYSSLNGKAYNGTEFTGVVPRKQETLVQYFTKSEKNSFGYTAVKNIYTGSYAAPKSGLLNPASYQSVNLNQPHIKGHHVAGYDLLKSDGMRYVYDIPVYNHEQHEFFFSIKGKQFYQNGQTVHPAKNMVYPGMADRLDTYKGEKGTRDRSYTQNSTSPYAHTYLLSYVAAPDYIDVDGNGPSDADMGYWAKFNYYAPYQYQWRMPYGLGEVSYADGYHSSSRDDRASFQFGKKDITYLHSVETKTHIAVFFLSDRTDGMGAGSVAGGSVGGQSLKKLDRIELYSKLDLNTPLKSVHFVYESTPAAQLCPGVPNSSISGGGKLTLKELYFTYKGSSKGSLSKYKFDYGTIYKEAANGSGYLVEDGSVNFSYANMKTDRWGSYSFNDDPDNPYTIQNRDSISNLNRRKIAVSWNLTKIELPMGGTIRIDYESDDYGYVQDKPVTQMVKIAGMGKRSDNNPNIIQTAWLDNGDVPIRKGYDLVYFEPLEPIPTALSDAERKAVIRKYVSQLPADLLYFKTWQRLQVPKNEFSWVYDYVTGYARPKMGPEGIPFYGYTLRQVGNDTLVMPYIQLDIADNPAEQYFRAAGLQYLRYHRNDLNQPQSELGEAMSAAQALTGMVTIIPQIIELMSGYYNAALMKDHCAMIGTSKNSYLKLNSPDGRKFGGGHRVRKMTVSDGWAMDGQTPSQYGTEYRYQNEDGSSSGVAIYEPILGNDENPLKKPHYYGPDNKFVNNDPAYYLEEPFGESYFPAPSVGYGRVVMVNIANNTVTRTGAGITVKEFYTAKDYPIVTKYNAAPERTEDRFDFMIPMIGSISMNARGYSQGFYIELNDMHGKPKADYTYDADLWNRTTKRLREGATPTAKAFYRYKTEGSYTPNAANRLANAVAVTGRTGVRESRVIGETAELFAEMAEDFTYTISAGAQINMAVDPAPYGIWVTPYPSVSYSEQSARIVVTTKVVSKMGVLEEVETFKDGVNQVTRNLVFDDETGQPVLTAVTDDYDDPTSRVNDRYIYTMQYPAYWYYSGMEPAYKNYRMTYAGSFGSLTGARKYFEEGDMVIRSNGTRLWVSKVNAHSVELKAADNSPVNNNFSDVFTVVRSGKRNLQSLSAGRIVSLNDPSQVHASHYALQLFIERMNQQAQTSGAANTAIPTGSGLVWDLGNITLCGIDYKMVLRTQAGNQIELEFSQPLSPATECSAAFAVSSNSPSALLADGSLKLGDLSFEYDTEKRFYVHANGKLSSIYQSEAGFTGCNLFRDCMDGILNAEATEYQHQWVYRPEFLTQAATFFSTNNDYLTGRAGIWRPKRSNVYFTERKQFGVDHTGTLGITEIGRDGTFKRFVPFNWIYDFDGDGIIDGNAANIQSANGWRWMAEIPDNGYNPYGFEIENKDALGIFSAALYGYNQSLSTATAKNAAYQEIAFDGFEEHGNGAGSPYVRVGHLWLKNTLHNPDASNPLIVNTAAHTGRYALSYTGFADDSLYIDVPVRNNESQFTTADQLQFVRGQSYTIGFWYRVAAGSVNDYWYLNARNQTAGVNLAAQILSLNQNDIEGWRRLELTFTVPQATAAGNTIRLALIPTKSNMNITLDDIRIHPADATFSSYVYDPGTYVLRAQLDDNNYATFYNYDLEDNLIQVKKETERGILTIQQTRKNVQN